MTTLATYVEMPTPRRAMDGGDDSLPADLTVAFGAAEAPVAGSVPLHDFLRTAGRSPTPSGCCSWSRPC